MKEGWRMFTLLYAVVALVSAVSVYLNWVGGNLLWVKMGVAQCIVMTSFAGYSYRRWRRSA